jgi:hypothetical protein
MKKVSYDYRSKFYKQEYEIYRSYKDFNRIKKICKCENIIYIPCSTGRNIKLASKVFKNSIFIDNSEKMVNMAQKSNKNKKIYNLDFMFLNNLLQKGSRNIVFLDNLFITMFSYSDMNIFFESLNKKISFLIVHVEDVDKRERVEFIKFNNSILKKYRYIKKLSDGYKVTNIYFESGNKLFYHSFNLFEYKHQKISKKLRDKKYYLKCKFNNIYIYERI